MVSLIISIKSCHPPTNTHLLVGEHQMRCADILLGRQLPDVQVVHIVDGGKGAQQLLLEDGNVDGAGDGLQQDQATLAHVRVAEREEQHAGHDGHRGVNELGNVLVGDKVHGSRADEDKEVGAQVPHNFDGTRPTLIAATAHLQKGDLVARVSADEQIGESVEQQSTRTDAQHYEGVVHGVLVRDVQELSDGFDERGEAQRGHEDAHD